MRTTQYGLLALLLGAASLSAAAVESGVDANWILAKLARPAPMRTSFVELRGSKLLKTPLRIEGEYLRPRDDTLVREVRAPYSETTTIRAGEVTIARVGKSPRTFSLSRSPELVGLQASFGALLAGDRLLLERHYRLATQGTRQQWALALTPKDGALAAKVRTITLYGRGAELRCIETEPAKSGDLQRTLLAGAARAAAGVADTNAMTALCHGS
ncbi:LolA-related protein [Lysobacter sp. CFH 32150]|uniref:LolA-related protein n=1 Tax=Lysobacter sp. CFH 32150 TaxID=2927128 RepID=UPI001FA6E89A|nr:LolA-related protein [Lysobacter sp. CFH 32150]MCI4569163.1 fatty acyl CoA synthetase [Lysobacter sp. CFH 32150]